MDEEAKRRCWLVDIFNLDCCRSKERPKKTWLGHIFVRNWRPNQKCIFLAFLSYPPQMTFYDSGPTGCTKSIPKYVFLHADSIFNFLLDSDEGKVKYSPLYGRGSKVTILVGRYFQSGMLPIERESKKT